MINFKSSVRDRCCAVMETKQSYQSSDSTSEVSFKKDELHRYTNQNMAKAPYLVNNLAVKFSVLYSTLICKHLFMYMCKFEKNIC